MTWERKPTPPYANRGARPADAIVESCCPPAVTTGLGDAVDQAIAKCLRFARNLQQLKDDGWKFVYGAKGKGSKTDSYNKEIIVDGKKKGRTVDVVTTLAHESGHAFHRGRFFPPPGLTKQEYIDKNLNSRLKGEGEATLVNIEVRDCLKANGGIEISIAGKYASAYEKIADKYPDSKDRDQARQEIADIFGAGEHPGSRPELTYSEYYRRTLASDYGIYQQRRKRR